LATCGSSLGIIKSPVDGYMRRSKMSNPAQVAEEHWEWLQSLLDRQREMEKKLFIDAFKHGFKHGVKEEQHGKECS